MGMVDIAPMSLACLNNKDENNLESLDEYLLLAKRSVFKFGIIYLNADLTRKMLASDDVISNIATELMIADCKWNGQGNKEKYRIMCAKFAVLKFIRRNVKAKQKKCISLQEIDNLDNKIANKIRRHDTKIAENEEYEYLISVLKKELSYLQVNYVLDYYINGYTLVNIANKRNVSKQSVQHVIERCLGRLKIILYDYITV